LEVDVVQIADNLPLHTRSLAEIGRLQRETQMLRLQVEVGTRGIAPEQVRRYLEIVQQFGSPLLRVVDTSEYHPAPEEIVTILRDLMPEFERARVMLAIENHDRFKARVLANIIEEIDSENVGICLDTVNSFGAGEGAEIVVETLGKYVINLHIKDFTIRRQRYGFGFEVEGRPAGQGMLDVPWLPGQLRDFGRDPNAILETWPPPETDLAQTIAKEDAWVVESLGHLHTLIKA
jgi:sugar phosphate isomerase/epimerase